MQQLVRLLRRQLLIERLENRVVLRRFDKRLAVCFIKTFGACIFLLLAADGLARAADTAGRAGHNLDEIKVFFTGFHLCNQLPCVFKTVDNADTDGLFSDGQFNCADAFHTTDAGVGDFLERIAGPAFHHATDDRLGDTAGGAEDDTGTGTETKWHIRRLIGQFIEADARFLDHADELLRGEHQIDVGLTVVREFAAAGLHLLCRAGHDGNVIELLIALFLLRAQKRGEHLHRGFARGDVVQIFRVLFLQIADPGRAAAGEHRERAALFKTLEELRRLFHDGHIGGKRRVVNFVCAHELQRGDHLVKDVCTGGQTERFAESGADGKRNLDDNVERGIMQRFPGVVDLVADGDRAGRTDCRALAAGNALGLAERPVKGRHDLYVAAAVGKVQDTE